MTATAIHPAFIGKSDILIHAAGANIIHAAPVSPSFAPCGIPYLVPYVPAYKASAKSARYSVSATVKANEK